jgi:hypothetical protein
MNNTDLTSYLPSTLGAGAIVAMAVLMIFRGLLVPRATLDMVREDKQQQIDTWKTLAEDRKKIIEEQAKQIDMLLESAQTTRRVLEALPEAARLNREGAGRAALAQTPQE